MLVIGVQPDNTPFHSELDVDVDIDSPRQIHDALMKKAGGITFTHIICIEDDTVVGEYMDQEDYDLTVDEDEDDSDDDDSDDDDGDDLHPADDDDDE